MNRWDEEHLAGRPECPYLPSFTMHAWQHPPPEPFGLVGYTRHPAPYYRQPFDTPRDSELQNMTRMEIVMKSPPLERDSSHSSHGKTSGPQGAATHRVDITKVLCGGDLHGAQIVLCTIHVLADKRSFTAVAKVYDPLYYRHFQINVDGQEVEDDIIIDTPEAADRDYSREAAAYEELQTQDMQGYTPAYYGSYTFTLATLPGREARHVRFILIEYLDGLCLAHLPVVPADVQDEDFRMAVFARVLEGQARVWHARVINCDDHPRNWIVIPSPPSRPHGSPRQNAAQAQSKGQKVPTHPGPQRVAMIDFGDSSVCSRSGSSVRDPSVQPQTALPINPLVAQWGSPFAGEHMDMVPRWYFRDPMRRQRWLVEKFYDGGEAKKYESLPGAPKPGQRLPEA